APREPPPGSASLLEPREVVDRLRVVRRLRLDRGGRALRRRGPSGDVARRESRARSGRARRRALREPPFRARRQPRRPSRRRRRPAHVFANVSVAAFALVAAAGSPEPRAGLFRLAAAAAFATALMDTVGTEVGQVVKTPTVLLPDLTRVRPGTDGAVSVAGTL